MLIRMARVATRGGRLGARGSSVSASSIPGGRRRRWTTVLRRAGGRDGGAGRAVGRGQDHGRRNLLLRFWDPHERRDPARRHRPARPTAGRAARAASRWWRRTPICSTTRWRRTSGWAARGFGGAGRTGAVARAALAEFVDGSAGGLATPRWANAACSSPAASGNVSPSPGPS